VAPDRSAALSGRARAAADAGAVLLVLALLWTPDPARLAGRIFEADLFFHWDHFVMAPALAWRHGMALGTQAYSEYGVGWPMLLDGASRWLPFSHQSALELAIAYACVVYAGLYGLLVALSGSRLLALAGTLLGLFLGPFAPAVGREGAHVLWVWPSLTVLRNPMEVWFFAALLAHARSRRAAWAVLAGALVGLGVLLASDTGIFLAVTFAVYGLCRVASDALGRSDGPNAPTPPARGPGARATGGALLAALAVLLAGLEAGSRGALLERPGAFLSAWITGMSNPTSIGVGAATFPWFLVHHGPALPWAMVAIGAGLLAVGWTAARLLHGRLDVASLLAGCAGLMALAHCTVFVWRTTPSRLVMLSIPLSILAVLALGALAQPLATVLRGRTRGARVAEHALPAVALVAAAAAVAWSPTFHEYPNLARAIVAGPRAAGIALFPERGEVTGLPPEMRGQARTLRAVAEEVRRRSERGERVAVIDPHKTLVFVEADVRPWLGSPAWFANTWTRDELERLSRQLGPRGPDVVVIRSRPPSPVDADVWQLLHATVAHHYVLAERIGIMEVWERRP
jgi:hypothetical protein